MKKFFGLGKGLESLIPLSGQQTPQAVSGKENVFFVEVHKVRPNPDQPRRDFDKDSLAELAQSIRKYGVLQPLLVSKVEEQNARGLNVYYQLIAGERRLRAAQLAGLPQVPVVIRDDPPAGTGAASQRLELALTENLQRDDLNPMDEAVAYERLATQFGLSQREIAEKVAKSREAVANTIRLTKLPAYIQDALRSGTISHAHGRGLLAFADEAKQREVFDQIIAGRLTTKDVEATAANAKPNARSGRRDGSRFAGLEKNLAEKLNVPVLIKTKDKGGHILIKFATHEELNVIAKSIID